MAGMGPPPKADGARRRRNATVATTKLPASGRTGRTPKWPLIEDIETRARRNRAAEKVSDLEYRLEEAENMKRPTGNLQRQLDEAHIQLDIFDRRLAEQRKMETTVWRELWRTPQAVQWERLTWTRDVAQYVRWKVLGELGDIDAAKEARQWSDRLGLTSLAMLRLRWEIVADEVTQQRETRRTASSPARPAGARSRMRVVDPHVAGA